MAIYSANIELLYTQHEKFEDRIRAAAADGFKYVEMWMSSLQDVASLAAVAKEVGVQFSSCLAEPRFTFNQPGPVDLNVFYDGLKQSIVNAKVLGSPRVVLGSGMGFPGRKRAPSLDVLVEAFKEACNIAAEHDIQLVLEPVNTRVDHPGALLDRTADGVYIAKKLNHPNFKLLYDIYHSSVEGEDVLSILKNDIDWIGYIQLADTNGRHEPGTGDIDWATVIPAVAAIGYTGPIGLEFYPSKDTTEAIQYIRSL